MRSYALLIFATCILPSTIGCGLILGIDEVDCDTPDCRPPGDNGHVDAATPSDGSIPAVDGGDAAVAVDGGVPPIPASPVYLKAANGGMGDRFGHSVAIAGKIVLVGANGEDSNDLCGNGSLTNSGAVYVFRDPNGDGNFADIVQDACLKAPQVDEGDEFGYSIATAGDLVVVGAIGEDSGTKCDDNDLKNSGAVYVFRDPNGDGDFADAIQEACLKAANPDADDQFGSSVATDGTRIIVGAPAEDSDGSSPLNNAASNAGAAYVFAFDGAGWVQEAYLKASNGDVDDEFGWSLTIDGNQVIVGARGEDGDGSNPANNAATSSGAAYVFAHNGDKWVQEDYLKASNVGSFDNFGWTVAADGDRMVVGAFGEASDGSSPMDNSAGLAGAAYVFSYNNELDRWSEEAYLKASIVGIDDSFGYSVDISGNRLVVGAVAEDGDGTNPDDNSVNNSGAAYVFVYDGSSWVQKSYLKAINPGFGDGFGGSVAIDGNTVVVGAENEDSNGSTPMDDTASNAGATYVLPLTSD